jgi:hypothetical protein
MKRERDDAKRYFDARTGGTVDCLPAERLPWIAKDSTGYTVSAVTKSSLTEAMSDRNAWIRADRTSWMQKHV